MSKYYERRQRQREKYWHELTTQELRELKRYYSQAAAEIEKEVAALYAKYGTENGLTASAARKLLRGEEFEQWRYSLEEYVKRSRGDAALKRELETLIARSRINRLEALHSRTLMELGDLSERLKEFSDALFYRAYSDYYYGNLYDIHRQDGLSTPPAAINRGQIEAVLQTPWLGSNYSARIWKNRTALATAVKETVLKGIHRGTPIQRLSRELSRRMEVGYSNAERLVRTELNHFQNRASADAMLAADFEYYQYVATLDRRTCARCGERDGEIYRLAEMNQGENAPPLHPRCRCTIIPSFGERLSGGRRIAEGRVKLPIETTYREWRAGIESGKIQSDANNTLNLPSAKDLSKAVISSDNSNILNELLKKYVTADYVIIDETNTKFMFYDVNAEKIFYNPKHANAIFYDRIKSLTHEIAHLIDYEFGISISLSSKIFEAVQETKVLIFAERSSYEEIMLGDLGNNMAVSDLVSAFTDSEIYGAFAHEANYWSIIGNREREIVAELATIYYLDDKEGAAFIGTFPKLKKLFEEVKKYYERSTEITDRGT